MTLLHNNLANKSAKYRIFVFILLRILGLQYIEKVHDLTLIIIYILAANDNSYLNLHSPCELQLQTGRTNNQKPVTVANRIVKTIDTAGFTGAHPFCRAKRLSPAFMTMHNPCNTKNQAISHVGFVPHVM